MFEALRSKKLGGRTNPGLRVIFDGLVLSSALSGGKVRGRTASELRGLNGAINLHFIGEGGGKWHIEMKPGSIRFRTGHDPAPRETIIMKVDDFFGLLTGKMTFMVAQMTGRLRIEGAGHSGLTLGMLVRQFQVGRTRGGRTGRIARTWTDLALTLSGSEHRFADAGSKPEKVR